VDGHTIGIALAVYAIILWAFLFFVWHKGYREWKANRANRLRKFRARVVDRRESAVSESTVKAVESYVTLEYQGRQQEFKVETEVYDASRIGREGSLYLRGGRFEAFDLKSEDEEAEDVYRKMVGS
jgi:hypothetical protein